MTTIDLTDLFERAKAALVILEREQHYREDSKDVANELRHLLKFQTRPPHLLEALAVDYNDWLNYLLEEVRIIEAIEFEHRNRQRVSQHIGTIGERRPFLVRISFVKSFPYEIEGNAFERHLTVSQDEDGNVVTYWNQFNIPTPTEEDPKLKRPAIAGERVSFDARVLTHNNYNGTKQTQIQRPTKIKLAII